VPHADLILMDTAMPVMDVCALAAIGKTSAAPYHGGAVTASAMVGDRLKFWPTASTATSPCRAEELIRQTMNEVLYGTMIRRS